MEKEACSGTMVILLLMGMLTLTFNVQLVKAEPRTWTVDDDGPADFSSIQEAINSPQVMDVDTIYVNNGTYYENLVVNKTVSLVGENKHTTTIDGSQRGTVVHIVAENVTLTGFTIVNSTMEYGNAGVLIQSEDCTIIKNIITGNGFGMKMEHSNRNIISGNNITKNIFFGMHITFSDHNNISGNSITDSRRGFWLYWSSDNLLEGNSMANNWYNFRVWGQNPFGGFRNDVDASNTADGKPIIYWVDKHNLTVPSNAGSVILVNCTYVTAQNLNLTKGGQGAGLAFTANSTIANNNITDNELGIWLLESSNNDVSGNIITDNLGGIYVLFSSNNKLESNSMANNLKNLGVFGDEISYFTNGVDVSNTVDGKPVYYWINSSGANVPLDAGFVALVNCTNTTVQNLTLTRNMQGLLLAYTANSTITNNNMTSNDFGVYLRSSENSIFYHNNFIANMDHVRSWNSYNTWDDGYPSGGNYWSDYAGVDEKSGQTQGKHGSDGIGDTPYIIDENNQDYYPLMEPWSQKPDPIEALEESIETIESWNLDMGIEKSLISKLQAAQRSLHKENHKASIEQLTAFINHVVALQGKTLTNEQANYVMAQVSEAQRIINLINE